jgi:hypothetical protein
MGNFDHCALLSKLCCAVSAAMSWMSCHCSCFAQFRHGCLFLQYISCAGFPVLSVLTQLCWLSSQGMSWISFNGCIVTHFCRFCTVTAVLSWRPSSHGCSVTTVLSRLLWRLVTGLTKTVPCRQALTTYLLQKSNKKIIFKIFSTDVMRLWI